MFACPTNSLQLTILIFITNYNCSRKGGNFIGRRTREKISVKKKLFKKDMKMGELIDWSIHAIEIDKGIS